ncbi:MAG: 4Fe-4S dicluster domain-containing protein [Desulfobacteraceae bacterium]|nr:4Fe-4S dicluster domain-containing protein [Desulfobacteraceae bacterium]
MPDLRRRDLLKLFGAGGTSAILAGCGEPARHLIPYVNPPEDLVPGKATYYATTCRECPAGCGMLAKNRDGRIIKVEGNPVHPISGGKLCMRGQASLHGLYNPDRFPGPMVRDGSGKLRPTTWANGETILSEALAEIAKKGGTGRIAVVSDLITGSLADLFGLWLAQTGQKGVHVIYEPLAYEPLRAANRIVFGEDSVPTYRLDDLDFLISFNAGFLETWISNLEFSRQFGDFHPIRENGKNKFVFVGPRLSMTANNADLWIRTRPGMEYAVALGMIRAILDGDLARDLGDSRKATLAGATSDWPVERAASAAGCDPGLIRAAAAAFARASSPLAIAEGLCFSVPNATETAVAANLLTTVKPAGLKAIDFGRASSCSQAAPAQSMKLLAERMRAGEVDLLLVYMANPVFSLPRAWDFAGAMKSVRTVVSLSPAIDETSSLAGLVLPTHYSFESWGDYSPRSGITGFLQPVMGPIFDTRHAGDILIATGKKAGKEGSFPFRDFQAAMQAYWRRSWKESGGTGSFDAFWLDALEKGGCWPDRPTAKGARPASSFSFAFPPPPAEAADGLPLVIYPTVQFFDGRMANHMWVQEIPDPMTMTAWGGWIEIHPDTAGKMGLKKGDLVTVKTESGGIEIPVLPIFTVPEGTAAIPVGQGHTNFGRYAENLPANPFNLLAPEVDPATGGLLRAPLSGGIAGTGRSFEIANTDGSFFQMGRDFWHTVTLKERNHLAEAGEKPEIRYPLPSGYEKERDFYAPHGHKDYRWCMVVDMDRCIGCSACVAGCYAENNVAVVGRKQVLMGREMSWIRVQRYFDEKTRLARWHINMCQHCDNAPCEYVCPVFAPHHNAEGLNTQIYNRCFGTRFCSQNDPYKVRRFNFYTYTRPWPLKWQLNPDVLVRQKGVMEKCSFCVHRIIEAKIEARNRGRKVKDGDFTTACAQTCPTGALVFGSLLDPDSRVSRLINDVRAYQALAELNTKPAVIYLKRVTQEIEA